ncbi:PREDICTED: G patch domain-containing protein 11-like [Priapulus caudatus]|uniref:G patch domain-containing protein 11 n=1 Tax=Priapulus caudatus TaxID=37621 RepID=A0ABM1EVT3_PRICU|nr:PREDICTED: G patch domain-containing protein 11-like [Priapulus caudatus]
MNKADTDSDDDYMSDAVLAMCEDKRPGLVSRNQARFNQTETKSHKSAIKNTVKSKKQQEREMRDSGLSKAITQDNKGFALLQKMGYQPGMALGRDASKGRLEPVGIQIKAGRGGLGQETAIKERQVEVETMRASWKGKRKMMDQNLKEEFMKKQRGKLEDRDIERDLKQSQLVCYQLDEREEVDVPVEPWFWPAVIMKGEEEEEDDVDEEDEAKEESTDIEPKEKLEYLTCYLRNRHTYCLWCGTTYTDQEDMKQNCPGDTAIAHK